MLNADKTTASQATGSLTAPMLVKKNAVIDADTEQQHQRQHMKQLQTLTRQTQQRQRNDTGQGRGRHDPRHVAPR